MFGISFNELIIIFLVMVIFLKPRDLPIIINFLVSIWTSLQSFILKIHEKFKYITSEINDNIKYIDDTFHDNVKKISLSISNEPDFFDYEEEKKYPKMPFIKAIKKKNTLTNKKKSAKGKIK